MPSLLDKIAENVAHYEVRTDLCIGFNPCKSLCKSLWNNSWWNSSRPNTIKLWFMIIYEKGVDIFLIPVECKIPLSIVVSFERRTTAGVQSDTFKVSGCRGPLPSFKARTNAIPIAIIPFSMQVVSVMWKHFAMLHSSVSVCKAYRMLLNSSYGSSIKLSEVNDNDRRYCDALCSTCLEQHDFMNWAPVSVRCGNSKLIMIESWLHFIRESWN